MAECGAACGLMAGVKAGLHPMRAGPIGVVFAGNGFELVPLVENEAKRRSPSPLDFLPERFP